MIVVGVLWFSDAPQNKQRKGFEGGKKKGKRNEGVKKGRIFPY